MESDDLIRDLFIPDENKAMEIFRQIRWSNGVYCPKCKSFNINSRGIQGKSRRYTCKDCELNFSDLTDSLLANRKLPIGEMFYILMNSDKKSIKRMSEELNHKRDGISKLIKDFREELLKRTEDPILKHEVEIDEMYYSAGNKGVKKNIPEKED